MSKDEKREAIAARWNPGRIAKKDLDCHLCKRVIKKGESVKVNRQRPFYLWEYTCEMPRTFVCWECCFSNALREYTCNVEHAHYPDCPHYEQLAKVRRKTRYFKEGSPITWNYKAMGSPGDS